jgi:hypothetical protein
MAVFFAFTCHNLGVVVSSCNRIALKLETSVKNKSGHRYSVQHGNVQTYDIVF